MNPHDPIHTNPFNRPNAINDPRKIVPNPFLTNNSIRTIKRISMNRIMRIHNILNYL